MKKRIKAMRGLATSGLALGALAGAGTSMGSPLVGNLTQGYGSMMPAVGSMMGVGMTIDAARMLQRKKKRR